MTTEHEDLTAALRRLVARAEDDARAAVVVGLLLATADGAKVFDDAPAGERASRVDLLRALAVGLLSHVLAARQTPGEN